jgi:hypothetical protein
LLLKYEGKNCAITKNNKSGRPWLHEYLNSQEYKPGMKQTVFFFLAFFFTSYAFAQLKDKPDSTKEIIVVEAACGQCQFGLKGEGCELAIRVNGKDYFVDGTGIDDHGDAHASDGFCNKIRKARVQGIDVDGRYKLSYFSLISPADKKH